MPKKGLGILKRCFNWPSEIITIFRNLSGNSFHFYHKRHAQQYKRQFLSGSLSKSARRVTNEPADRQTSPPTDKRARRVKVTTIISIRFCPPRYCRANREMFDCLDQMKYFYWFKISINVQWLDERSGRKPNYTIMRTTCIETIMIFEHDCCLGGHSKYKALSQGDVATHMLNTN